MNSQEYEVLAMRLLLAYLTEDDDESAFLVWAVLDESGCSREQFQVAARTAREAASWWHSGGCAEHGRRRILSKLERLTGVAA